MAKDRGEQRTAAWIPNTASAVARGIGGFFSGGDNDDAPFQRNPSTLPGTSGRQGHHPPISRNPNTGAVSTPRTPSGSGISSWGLGSFTSPSGAANTAPRTPRRTGNTASQPTGGRSTNNATGRSGWGIFGGTTAAERIGMGSSRVANSQGNAVISTEAQRKALPVTAHNMALRQPGARALPGGNVQRPNASGGTTTRVTNPGALNRTNVSGNQVIRTQTQQRNLPVTANNQRIADEKVATNAAGAVARGDQHNWAGIARDLGNAGAKPWAAHATGDLPSTNAMAFVRANPTMATPAATRRANVNAPGATAATASAGAGLAAAKPRMSQAQSIAKRRENAAPYRASLQRRSTSSGTTRPVVRNEAQRRALPVTPHNQARRRAAAGGRNQPV